MIETIDGKDMVELRHYGRHPGLDRVFSRWLGRGKAYESAWKVTANIRKYWPAFMRWTTGECQFIQTYRNGITNAGKAAVAGLVGNTGSITAFTYLAYSSGTTAFAATQTALVTTDSQRSAATVTRTTTTVTNDTLQLTKTFSISSTETAAEGGIFNASSGGTMLARVVFSPARSMASGDTLAYTHKIAFA